MGLLNQSNSSPTIRAFPLQGKEIKYPVMNKKVIDILKNGGVAVLPTDTIYGLHALALNQQAVEKIYQIKHRGEHKPLIILISDLSDLEKFGVEISPSVRNFLKELWPNPISVILPTNQKTHLHKGTHSLAFRMPKNEALLNLLKQTGPLVSTSANPEGQLPAQTIEEAKTYFADQVDFYQDGGRLESQPSTVIKFADGKPEILRPGSPTTLNLIKNLVN